MKTNKLLAFVLTIATIAMSSVNVFADYTAPTKENSHYTATIKKYTEAEVVEKFGLTDISEAGLAEGTFVYNIVVATGGYSTERVTTVTKNGLQYSTSYEGVGIAKMEVAMKPSDYANFTIVNENEVAYGAITEASLFDGHTYLFNGASSLDTLLPLTTVTNFKQAQVVTDTLDWTETDKVLFDIDVIATNDSTIVLEPSARYEVYANSALIPEKSSIVTYDAITLTCAEPKTDPVPGTVGTKDGYTTVVDDDKATRFVVTDTKASIDATAASVLKVTYAGETRQANLYKLLGVEAGATGDVTIGSLTIKMVLPATVQDAASIGAYSFIVE